MFADEIARAVAAAPRAGLPQVAALLWRAFGAGHVTEDEAATLSGLIEARTKAAQDTRTEPRAADPAPLAGAGIVKRYGSRPRTDASLERRRRWAASGRLPPALASRFTAGEQAVLSVVAAEVVKRGDCRLHLDHLAALAGVGRTTVKNALREARVFGLLTVEERRLTGFRNASNVVRIISAEWQAWNRLARRGDRPSSQGGGVKSATGTHTVNPSPGNSGPSGPSRGCRQAAGDPRRIDRSAIRAGGGAGRAMR